MNSGTLNTRHVTCRCVLMMGEWLHVSDSLCSVFIAGGLWCSTVNGLCSVSSPSSSCSETRFWPGDLSDWASVRAACASLCWCKRWKRIPSPVPGSDTLNMDISSCASFGHLKDKIIKRQKVTKWDIIDTVQQHEIISCFEAAVVVYMEFKCLPARSQTYRTEICKQKTGLDSGTC